MGWDGRTESIGTIHAALDSEINLINTAPVYAGAVRKVESFCRSDRLTRGFLASLFRILRIFGGRKAHPFSERVAQSKLDLTRRRREALDDSSVACISSGCRKSKTIGQAKVRVIRQIEELTPKNNRLALR